MTDPAPVPVTKDMMETWANDDRGPVALHLKQALVPVESVDGEPAVLFPPTYAGKGYEISQLSDGSKIAQIDSVGSQANRIEPLFRRAKADRKPNPMADLVPQVEIVVDNGKIVSLLDAGHRLGDAIVRASELKDDAKKAFEAFRDSGDATLIAKLAPTTLVFGAWDSRDTEVKLPRVVQSVIRAWDVEILTRSAQYIPPLDYSELDIFTEEDKAKAEKDSKTPLAQRGYVHVPATNMPGGIIARGGIFRDVTVNLVALRSLEGENGSALRQYVLGLSLIAAAEPPDSFLRQGCLLTPDRKVPAAWAVVHRDGERRPITLTSEAAFDLAKAAAKTFGVGPDRRVDFSKKFATEDVKVKK